MIHYVKFLKTVLEVPTEHQCARHFPTFNFSALLLFSNLPGLLTERMKQKTGSPFTDSAYRSGAQADSSTQLAGGNTKIIPTFAPQSLRASERWCQGQPPAVGVLAVSYSGSLRDNLRASNNAWALKLWPCLPR